MVISRRRRLVLGAALLGVLLTLGAAAFHGRAIVARLVTWSALRDARARVEAAGEEAKKGSVFIRDVREPLIRSYESLFRAGLFDTDYVLDRIPVEATRLEALPVWAVIGVFVKAHYKEVPAPPQVLVELFQALVGRASFKEVLVNVFVSDFEFGVDEREGSNWKYISADLIFRDPPKELQALMGSRWDIVWRDVDHPREKVRAGSLLLLYRCPDRDRARERARAALRDPSSLVRLAAGGTLALEGDFSGAPELLEGLAHERGGALLVQRGPHGLGRDAVRPPAPGTRGSRAGRLGEETAGRPGPGTVVIPRRRRLVLGAALLGAVVTLGAAASSPAAATRARVPSADQVTRQAAKTLPPCRLLGRARDSC